jgi:hypothetical protein
VVNEDADQRTLLRKYERELRRLRAELTRRNKELVDKRHLLEVRAWFIVFQLLHGGGFLACVCVLHAERCSLIYPAQGSMFPCTWQRS